MSNYCIPNWEEFMKKLNDNYIDCLLNEVKNRETYINPGRDKYFKGYKPNYYFKDVRR